MIHNAYETIIKYHQRTKHTQQQYAAGPGTLDWDAQPDPFRRFEGAQRIGLPLTASALRYSYANLLKEINPQAQALSLQSLGSFFQLSLGLSAWKQYDTNRWSLRCNPSSGNLHPTEAYIVLPDVGSELTAGVYHYDSYDHCLEQRCKTNELTTQLASDSFLLALSSIHWREAWKYGERAYRYCQLDVGHALAALRLSAAIHGWQLELVSACSDEQLKRLIGLNRTADFDNVEKEEPDLLLVVKSIDHATAEYNIDALIEILHSDNATWQGVANLLDSSPMYHWPVIHDVSQAAQKFYSDSQPPLPLTETPVCSDGLPEENSIELILQRRSAQAFAPNHRIDAKTLIQILESTLVQQDQYLFDGLNTNIHLLVFVHRVDGLDPGLYMLIRNTEAKIELENICRKEFDWHRPDNIPKQFPLYHLVSANGQKVARSLACHQAIASDGMFSIAMLANFDSPLQQAPWQYRSLHWEAGLVGQSIYLAAEAHGLRGTGMGCFFDDDVHALLGMDTLQYQCLYQFTVGVPVIDSRILTLPPYDHLQY